MKIKLAYPKIPDTLNCPLKQCVAFEKYDGTNIHWVWKPNMGWLDFGTRRDRFPLNNGGVRHFEQAHPELVGLDQLWDQDPNNSLELYLWDHPRYNTVQEVIVFTEYFGPKSFAGSHDPKDEKQLVIFDVMVDGKVIPPEQMLEDFKKWNLAKVIFQGKFTGQLFVDVRKGKYPVREGVVVKGVVGNEVYMAKIKTEAYMDKLRTQFKDNWKEYWE
jgi:RNA ligase